MIENHIAKQTNDFLEQKEFTFDSSFKLLQLLSSNLDENIGQVRESVIRILDQWNKIPIAFHDAWNNLIEAVGLYPYMDKESITGGTALRYEFHRSPNTKEIIFHSEQRRIWSALSSGKSTVLSAPTSFGKSLLIEQLVASNKYKNIVIIQPTLALLDETREKLSKYNHLYTLVLSTVQKLGERNIFLLTAERVVEYKEFPEIDFFVIDEFYKLSSDRDDERSIALNIALYLLLQKTRKFYFLGPNIYKIPEDFISTYDAKWVKSDFVTVAVDVEKIVGPRGSFISVSKKREEKLFDLLESLNGEQTIIFCSKPKRTVELANKFRLYLQKKNIASNASSSKEIGEVVEWIQEHIHKDWSLVDILKSGIAFHHSSIPRHLSVSLIDLFNNGELKYLFCTSTIIEGVNTSAKNVVLFDTAKGQKPIDFFDYKNISGRSGRMKKHYIGKVFQFHQEPEENNIEVDIPFFTQDKAPLELLIHLNPEDVKPENKDRMSLFNSLSEDERQLIKLNFGAPIEGQITVIKLLTDDDGTLYELLKWKTYSPSWKQVEKTIEICFQYLIPKKSGNFTAGQLAVKLSEFLKNKNVKVMIEKDINSEYNKNKYPDYDKRVQIAVESNLFLFRNWFGFILPKCLGILNNLQKYVFEKKGYQAGNYGSVIYGLENRFEQDNLLPFLDYSLPTSLLLKLKKYIDPELTFEESLKKIRSLDLSKVGLMAYERKLIEKLLKSNSNNEPF